MMQSPKERSALTLAAIAMALCTPVAMRAQVTAVQQEQPAPPEGSRIELRPASILIWSDLNTPGFAPGATMAVVHGDPGAHRDYIIRLKFPAGYRFPVHWHPNSEHLTVLSGTFLLAMGNTADESKLKAYGPGDFIYAPARMSHYGGARTPTVIQLSGNGPFAINLGVAPPGK